MKTLDLKVSGRKEAIDMALKQLDVYVKKPMGKSEFNIGTGGDNGRYGAVCVTPDDKLRLYHTQHPCHAFMRDYKNPVVVFNQYSHRPAFLKDEADLLFFDWIMSDDSPWKAFSNRLVSEVPEEVKDIKNFIWNNGWVWSDLSFPSNLQHNFLVAARMASEWPKHINRWYDLVIEDGLDKALSFVFLDVFIPVVSDEKKFVINHKNKYDWPIDVCTSEESYVRNFMAGNVEALNKPYADDPQYKPVNRIFGVNTLDPKDTRTYTNQIFEMYHNTFGVGESACADYWSKKGTGMSNFKYSDHWYVTENEIKNIIRQEFERLKA